MKKTNKIIASITALALLTPAIAPLGNAFAASTPTWTNNVSSVSVGHKLTYGYSFMGNDYGLTITPSASNPAGATGAPTSATIEWFSNLYGMPWDNIVRTVDLDFSSMQFERVGDYIYTVRETSSTDSAVFPIDTTSYYNIIISVRNNADLTGFVASLYVQNSSGNKISDIEDYDTEAVFTSTPVLTNIQITATASGNAADPNKCFEYNLTFSDPYNFSNRYDVTTDSTCTNNDRVGNGYGTIFLKAGDTMTIGLDGVNSEIPIGTTYSITKVNPDDEYTVSIDNVARSTISKTMVAPNHANYNTANKTTIDEHLEAAVPTNASMGTAVYALLVLGGAAGVFYVAKKKSTR